MEPVLPLASTAPARSWRQLLRDPRVLAWSLYDWANSSFATTVMAGFFPLFFKKYWSAGTDPNISTFQLGFANSLSSAALALLSPILGAIADQGSSKKRFLIAFTGLGIVMTGTLPLVAMGDWPSAIILYLIASIGFAGGNAFYDSLLVFVARPRELNKVSALGYALGYLGGGVLFAINVLMTLQPRLFGLADAAQAVRVSFATVAVWWAVFSLPLFFRVREPSAPGSVPLLRVAKNGIVQVLETFHQARRLRNVGLFLIAYFFYIDGVNTIIRMAVDYGLSLGFPSESLITALLITQFVGFPAALVFGQIAHKTGSKQALMITIAVYIGVNIYAYWMNEPWQFYLLAIVIGLVQGGIQSVSRSVFGQMIPRDQSGEFFGFFNMLGKFSSMVGPLLVGLVSIFTRDARLSILSIIALFVTGAALLAFVDIPPETTAMDEDGADAGVDQLN